MTKTWEKKMVFVSYFGITKIGQERPVKGHNCGFFCVTFPKLGHLESYTSLYACVVWGFNRE